jgi:hypothetical protein
MCQVFYRVERSATMSEYQYYEFQAIDHPLSNDDRKILRDISTRAEITTTSFINHYEWGDLKGDPIEFMRQWFDIHVYIANWGNPRLMIRLPREFADLDRFATMIGDADYSGVIDAGQHVILDLSRAEVEPKGNFDDGTGWMDRLKPLRADLLAGDIRLLYLIWLIGVEDGMYDDDDGEVERRAEEPLPGIGPLTPQLKAAAEFFYLDQDLVAAAAERTSGPDIGELPGPSAVRTLIASLPDEEKVDYLVQLYERNPLAAAHVQTRVRRLIKKDEEHPAAKPRTVKELLSRAETLRERRLDRR